MMQAAAELTPKHTPAPQPLPTHWARAIASDIAARLAREGWRRADQRRAIHPTGNPPGYRYAPRAFKSQAPTTELLSVDRFVWGTLDPRDHRGLDLPPLIYLLSQLDLAGELIRRADSALTNAGQTWLERSRKASVTPALYILKPNRHGNGVRIIRNDSALPEEAAAFDAAATTARVYEMDPLDYFDWVDAGDVDLRALQVVLGDVV